MKRTIGVLICVLVLIIGLSMPVAAVNYGEAKCHVDEDDVTPTVELGGAWGWTWDNGDEVWRMDWDKATSGPNLVIEVYVWIEDACDANNTMDAKFSVSLNVNDLDDPPKNDIDSWENDGWPNADTFDGTYVGVNIMESDLLCTIINPTVNDDIQVDLSATGWNCNNNPPTSDDVSVTGIITVI